MQTVPIAWAFFRRKKPALFCSTSIDTSYFNLFASFWVGFGDTILPKCNWGQFAFFTPLFSKPLKASNKKKKLYKTHAGMLLTDSRRIKLPSSQSSPDYLLTACLHCVVTWHLAFIVWPAINGVCCNEVLLVCAKRFYLFVTILET